MVDSVIKFAAPKGVEVLARPYHGKEFQLNFYHLSIRSLKVVNYYIKFKKQQIKARNIAKMTKKAELGTGI